MPRLPPSLLAAVALLLLPLPRPLHAGVAGVAAVVEARATADLARASTTSAAADEAHPAWMVVAREARATQSGSATRTPQQSSATKSSATKSAAKQSAAKQSTAKKTVAKKTAAKKSAAKKSAARKSTKKAARPSPVPRPPAPGWPVKGPDPLPGSLLPGKRIVAYYGNPLSKRMGVLGEYEPRSMLRRLDREVEAWSAADTLTPVVPALHLVVTVAQGSPGKDGKWRTRMSDSLVERVYDWAHKRQALLFLDVQIARSTLQDELPWLEKYLARPDVHLGIDPEFAMKGGDRPGKRVGSYDARDVDWTVDFLAGIVDKYQLPPKVLVIHRFTRPMLTNADKIRLDPRVQIVIDMDGWGGPAQKRATYEAYVASEPVQFTGFKIFYKNDVRKKGWRLMRPADVLALHPKPVYIQYQ